MGEVGFSTCEPLGFMYLCAHLVLLAPIKIGEPRYLPYTYLQNKWLDVRKVAAVSETRCSNTLLRLLPALWGGRCAAKVIVDSFGGLFDLKNERIVLVSATNTHVCGCRHRTAGCGTLKRVSCRLRWQRLAACCVFRAVTCARVDISPVVN